MSDIFEQNLIDRIASAQLSKAGKNKDRINAKLLELQDKLALIDQKKQTISDENSYSKYKDFIKGLLETTIEQITAPNVDDFFFWVSEIFRNNGNQKNNLLRLKEILIKNYTDILNGQLESIILNKDILEIKTSIFNKLLANTTSQITKELEIALNNSAELQNNVDGMLSNLCTLLQKISNIPELKYNRLEQFYSENQIKNNIEWYKDIIVDILEESQSLKHFDEIDKEDQLISRVTKRISALKDSINILDKTGIANFTDSTLQNIFFKFKEDMVIYKGGLKANLNNFIEHQWSEIEQNYTATKSFFESKKDIRYKTSWDNFINGSIKPLINEYKEILKLNPLQNIHQYKPKGITDSLTQKNKLISEFKLKCASLTKDIVKEFERLISEYESKNIPLLENLATSKPTLLPIIESIKLEMAGLKIAKDTLIKNNDVISYLEDEYEFDAHLNSYNSISELFTQALQESGKRDHLVWLETKLNGDDKGDLTTDDFKNSEYVSDLLEIGLVKIFIEKQF